MCIFALHFFFSSFIHSTYTFSSLFLSPSFSIHSVVCNVHSHFVSLSVFSRIQMAQTQFIWKHELIITRVLAYTRTQTKMYTQQVIRLRTVSMMQKIWKHRRQQHVTPFRIWMSCTSPIRIWRQSAVPISMAILHCSIFISCTIVWSASHHTHSKVNVRFRDDEINSYIFLANALTIQTYIVFIIISAKFVRKVIFFPFYLIQFLPIRITDIPFVIFSNCFRSQHCMVFYR